MQCQNETAQAGRGGGIFPAQEFVSGEGYGKHMILNGSKKLHRAFGPHLCIGCCGAVL